MTMQSSLQPWTTPLFADHGNAIAVTRGGGGADTFEGATKNAADSVGNTEAVTSNNDTGSSDS